MTRLRVASSRSSCSCSSSARSMHSHCGSQIRLPVGVVMSPPRRSRARFPGRRAARRGSRAAPRRCPAARSGPSRARSPASRCCRALRAFCSTRSTVVPSSAIRFDDREDVLHHERGEPHRRLVEHHEAGAGHERPADGEHLLLAARERAGELPLPLLEDGEERVHALEVARPPRARRPRRDLHVRAEEEVLPHRHRREDLPPLGHERAAEGDDVARWGAASRSPRRRRPSRPPGRARGPTMVLSSVVFPAPFAPTMVTISPWLTWSETRRSTVRAPYPASRLRSLSTRRPPGRPGSPRGRAARPAGSASAIFWP